MTASVWRMTLTKHGHEVFVVSTGKPGKNKYVVKEIFMTPVVRHIVHSQGMVIARANKKVLREAMQEVDIVHFIMPFHLSSVGLRIARELSVPCTAAFHVQPENITYTLHMGRMKQVNRGIYYMFRENFFNKFPIFTVQVNLLQGQLRENGYTAKLHVISNGVDEDFVYRKKEKTPELWGNL